MAHMGRIQQINYEPFLEVYNKTWQSNETRVASFI